MRLFRTNDRPSGVSWSLRGVIVASSSSLSLVFLWVLTQGVSALTNDRPNYFTAYWNVPAQRCYSKYNISMPLNDYHIVHNQGYKFIGNRVVLLYEYKVGLFPYFESYNASLPINGGLPQKCDIPRHLQVLEEQIKQLIPDENFDGLGIFDVEEWRPMFHLNWGAKHIYKRESFNLVKERLPKISRKSAIHIAKQEFNMATKKLLTSTLKLARRLRPLARWSLYGFPYCNYDAGRKGEFNCNKYHVVHNDRLRWLTDELSFLAPSIYLSLSETDGATNFRYIHAIMAESRRIAFLSSPRKPIIAYTKLEYNPYSEGKHLYYDKRDLCSSLKHVAETGAEGVLVWSTDKGLNANRCRNISDYVFSKFGPTASLVQRRVNLCAAARCSGHGRCILTRQTDTDSCTFKMPPSSYHCECTPPYYGDFCQFDPHTTSTPEQSTTTNSIIETTTIFERRSTSNLLQTEETDLRVNTPTEIRVTSLPLLEQTTPSSASDEVFTAAYNSQEKDPSVSRTLDLPPELFIVDQRGDYLEETSSMSPEESGSGELLVVDAGAAKAA